MSVFKTAMRVVFRYPLYLLIYIVLFGFLGFVVTGANSTDTSAEVVFQSTERPLAVIDHDHSGLSQSLTAYLGKHCQLIELEDDLRAMQDAIAQNTVSYILMIPSGYEEAFMSAARSGLPSPELQGTVSVEAISGMLIDGMVTSYLNALRVNAMLDPGLPNDVLFDKASQAAELRVPVEVVQTGEKINRNSLLPFFFKFSAYPITQGVAVLVALVFTNFYTGELRRRGLAAPLSSMSMNSQIALACMVIVLMTWAFICLLSLFPIIGGWDLIATNPMSAFLIMLSALVYSLLPLAIGFLLSQFNLGEMATNGFVVIIALTVMFLSGIMMGGSDYLDGVLLTVGRFMPSYWYSEAIDHVVMANDYSFASLSQYFVCLGLIMLFNLAVFSTALFIGRLRAQTADAGGNAAAATP
ncbi:MAG: ABC transporter permease [Coriobacteriia bacterium]|nr:ABC transporter permease [Coriobacteriia bacterium]